MSNSLLFRISSDELINTLTRHQALEHIRNGEYDPENEILTISFTQYEVEKIAIAQLDLLLKDLKADYDKIFFSEENYEDAISFLKTEAFIHCCFVATGASKEEAMDYSNYLQRRYSKEYKSALKEVVFGSTDNIADTVPYKGLEFAYELAVFIFDGRLSKSNLLDDFNSSDRWKQLSKIGIKTDVARRHLNHLIRESRTRY